MGHTVIFPGSFDPITLGHEQIIHKALSLFDSVVVAIGINADKRTMFTVEQRCSMIRTVFANEPRVKVVAYDGLTVDFCISQHIRYILRGLRSASDFDYELGIAYANRALDNTIETLFLVADPQYSHINSSIVRDVLRHKGNVSAFIPKTLTL
ncbi:phosphopantetheine adenylyltransferase [Bacteroidia bacterium]|nr:phosphopantetheine adenylyltransferase [Bacteroidia bacterium]